MDEEPQVEAPEVLGDVDAAQDRLNALKVDQGQLSYGLELTVIAVIAATFTFVAVPTYFLATDRGKASLVLVCPPFMVSTMGTTKGGPFTASGCDRSLIWICVDGECYVPRRGRQEFADPLTGGPGN